jgi:AcrR family transcriptional regulator
MTESGRRPRADARRNRARVLAAASRVFASRGLSASTDEVARAAGVGAGTLVRHFPTRQALIEAVLVERQQEMVALAERALDEPDAGAALFGFIDTAVHRAGEKAALTQSLAATGTDVDALTQDTAARLRELLAELLGRAQRQGAVRDDIGLPELAVLLVGAARSAEHAGEDDALSRRALAVLRDGLAGRNTGDGSP